MIASDTFRTLHHAGTIVLANPWDIGSARLFAAAGFPALATTSGGLAASLGRLDQTLRREELIAHVAALTASVDVPVTVDAEDGYGGDAAAVAETVRLLAAAGAAGCSIEDYDARSGQIRPLGEAVERVTAAAEAAHGMVITGRCEHHLYGLDDLDATIGRLRAYGEAGAECVYAPGLLAPAAIRRVVEEVGVAVNVLAMAGGLTVTQLGSLGVRRVSTGSWLSTAAYGAALDLARSLAAGAGVPADVPRPPHAIVAQAWGGRGTHG